MHLLTAQQMKAAEEKAVSMGTTLFLLMENAGGALAKAIVKLSLGKEKAYVVLCGKGNNGGDGFVAARILFQAGYPVRLVLCPGAPASALARGMYQQCVNLRIPALRWETDSEMVLKQLSGAGVIVDAVYGTGFHGTLDPGMAGLFSAANESAAHVISADIPSGVNADNGETVPGCIAADMTVTFGFAKPGHLIYPGAGQCGKVVLDSIGIREECAPTDQQLIEVPAIDQLQRVIPEKALNTNKGDFGRLLCVTGSRGMSGAAFLSALAATRCGLGLCYVLAPDALEIPLSVKLNEAVLLFGKTTVQGTLSSDNIDFIVNCGNRASACLIGCGLGRGGDVEDVVAAVIQNLSCPIVVDADGINAIASRIDILQGANGPIILTPHPGEMARVFRTTAEEIQTRRLFYAQKLSEITSAVVVLKGANTITACPDGRVYVNDGTNPGMSKGGSGDVLAGMIASFAAQGFEPGIAAAYGVFIHSEAARLCCEKQSVYAMLPTDIIGCLPQLFLKINR